MTSREQLAQEFQVWLNDLLTDRKMSGPDLHRAIGTDRISRFQVRKWTLGQLPNVEGARMIAEALEIDEREVFIRTGHRAALSDREGAIIAADPAASYIQRIRDRKLPHDIEERLIAEVRKDFQRLDEALTERLDTVEAAVRPAPDAER